MTKSATPETRAFRPLDGGSATALDRWRQGRAPLPASFAAAERRARLVLALTLVTMLVELVAGFLTGSMALLADGWHMGSHAAALGITAFAYAYARQHADNDRFAFGTGKVSALGGYSSALLLGVVAFLVGAESVQRLIEPEPVDFRDALLVAAVGLVVNLTSALLLSGRGHHHGHGHDHGHDHPGADTCDDPSHRHGPGQRVPHDHHHVQHGHDHNLRAAYLHVVADALTSLLAIGALVAGGWLGLAWLDPLVGVAAAALIAWWAVGLLRTSSRVLLDAEDHAGLRAEIARLLEQDADNRVADVRVWSLGGQARAAIVTVVTHRPRSAAYYKALIAHLPHLHHVTAEVHLCDAEPCELHPAPEGLPPSGQA